MRTWDYIYCVPVGKWMALRFNIWVVSEVNGRSNAWVFSIGVMGGGPVREETVDLCTSEHNNQEVCENMLTVILSNPSLSSPPNPTLCRLLNSIYPARAAISPQWSNANGLSVQEVRDGCGSERNSWEIFGTPGQKQVKAGAETKPEMQQVGVGKEAQPLSSCVTLAVIGSEAAPCGRKCEQMFFLMETLCQGVWVEFANSAMDAGVENFSLPKKEMPKKSRAYIVSEQLFQNS